MEPIKSRAFDDMVEALEENEDMVECKECFDLFPKSECMKATMGYVCPACGKGGMIFKSEANPKRIQPDCTVDPFDTEFPSILDYAPERVRKFEDEPQVTDALDALIADEYDDIDGYEVADETVQQAAIPEARKEQILDTLDHIKEEEEEHIDELKEVCPECDIKEGPEKLEEKLPREPQVYDDKGNLIKVKDPEVLKIWGKVVDQAEADGVTSWNDYTTQKQIIDKALTPEEIKKLKKVEFEDGVIRTACESLVEDADEEMEEIPEEAEDSEENENKEISDLESAYEAALEIANDTGVGQVFGYAKQETEEFVAIDPIEVDDPEAVDADLLAVYDDVAFAYVAYPERDLSESLFESTQLTEAELTLGRRAWDAITKKTKAGLRKLSKASFNLDDIFTKGYGISIEKVAEEDKIYQGRSLEDKRPTTIVEAEKFAKSASKYLPKANIYLYAILNGVKFDDNQIKKLVDFHTNKSTKVCELAKYKGGKVINETAIEKINKRLQQIELATRELDAAEDGPGNSGRSTSTSTDVSDEDKLAERKAERKNELGKKKDSASYTPDSYTRYSKGFEAIVKAIEDAESLEDLDELDIEYLRNKAESYLKKASAPKTDEGSDEDEEDGDLEEEEIKNPLEAARKKALDLLGEKKDPAAYTEDSYAQYSAKYDRYFELINKAKKLDTFTNKYLPQLPGLVDKMNKFLVEVEDEDLGDGEEEPD